MIKIRRIFGVTMPIRILFENPTIKSLWREIESRARGDEHAESVPIKPVRRDNPAAIVWQQSFWLIHQLEPDSAAYNIPSALRLRGELDISSLSQSLQQIVNRHEVLRTRFEVRDGQPVQIIDEANAIELAVWDPSNLSRAEREQQAQEIAEQNAGRPFDLEQGPLWRTGLGDRGGWRIGTAGVGPERAGRRGAGEVCEGDRQARGGQTVRP